MKITITPDIEQALNAYHKVEDGEYNRTEKKKALCARLVELEKISTNNVSLLEENAEQFKQSAIAILPIDSEHQATISRQRTKLKNSIEETTIQIDAVKEALAAIEAEGNPGAGHPIAVAKSILYSKIFNTLRVRCLRALPDIYAAYAAEKLSSGMMLIGLPDVDFSRFLIEALRLPVPRRTDFDALVKELDGLTKKQA